MKTYVPKQGEIQRGWWLVDAGGKTLGRLATVVASHLRGKHKPMFTPFLDTGDHVIVVNADKIVLTVATVVIRVASKKSAPKRCSRSTPSGLSSSR